MGLDLVYQCGDRDLVIRFSIVDWRAIDRLKSHLPDAIATLVDVPVLGGKATVPLGALREAAGRIDGLVRDRPELLPHNYQTRCEDFAIDGRRIESAFATGRMSGFHLPGDEEHWYSIQAGLDECRLDQMARQPDGTVRVVERRDLRGVPELQTADWGLIRIRTRRARTSLRARLARIRVYLAGLPEGAEITKLLC